MFFVKQKSKRGRPKIAKIERRSSLVAARFSAEERRLLENAARKRRLNLSKWIREVLLQNAGVKVDIGAKKTNVKE